MTEAEAKEILRNEREMVRLQRHYAPFSAGWMLYNRVLNDMGEHVARAHETLFGDGDWDCDNAPGRMP